MHVPLVLPLRVETSVCGMRATDGAIEACTLIKETMEPTYKVVGDPGTKPVGLCGSGIIDVISELFMTGIINPKGKFVREGQESPSRSVWHGKLCDRI